MMIRRCDVAVMTPGWEKSKGTTQDILKFHGAPGIGMSLFQMSRLIFQEDSALRS